MKELKTYVSTKPVQVYAVGDFEIEAQHLWDAVNELKAQIEYDDGRGTRKLDYEMTVALKAVGLIVPGLMTGAWLPSDLFGAFCDDLEIARRSFWERNDGWRNEMVWRINAT